MNLRDQRLHATIYGRVQGVSFRFYTIQKARELQLTGWAMNLRNGAVEVVAEGARGALESLYAWLHVGSPAARVDRVEATWDAATGEFSEFDVRYSNG